MGLFTKAVTPAPAAANGTALGPVAEDAALVAALARQAEASAAHAASEAELRRVVHLLNPPLGAPPAEDAERDDARADARERERDFLRTRTALAKATATADRARLAARAARMPAARARLVEPLVALYRLLDAAAQVNAGLAAQIAEENAALGAQVFAPGDLVWPEFLDPNGLLDHRRRYLATMGFQLDADEVAP